MTPGDVRTGKGGLEQRGGDGGRTEQCKRSREHHEGGDRGHKGGMEKVSRS